MEPIDLALLILRLGIAWVFLRAAWANVGTPAARRWTRGETALLLRPFGIGKDHWIAALCGFVGMLMMIGGGLAVLVGTYPRLGGLAIVLFSLMGMRIHAIRRDEAQELATSGPPIAWSAYGAHIAAGLKNWALAAAGAFFMLEGTGRFSLGPDPFAVFVANAFN